MSTVGHDYKTQMVVHVRSFSVHVYYSLSQQISKEVITSNVASERMRSVKKYIEITVNTELL